MLEGRFRSDRIRYDAETYAAHLRETEAFASEKSPERHFMIYHPRVVGCIYDLSIPIWDK